MKPNPRFALTIALSAASLGTGMWGLLAVSVEGAKPQTPPVPASTPSAELPPADILEMSRKEVERRETARLRAVEHLKLARGRMSVRDYQQAVKHYSEALKDLPESRNNMRERAEAMTGFRDASLELAKVRVSEGRHLRREGQQMDSAEDILKALLEREPTNRAAKRELERLYDPAYTNHTFTPSVRAELKDVQKFLIEAQGFYEIGKFDLAMKRADQVLDVDPYNSAARKIQQMANDAVSRYGETAYDEARARAMRNVQKAWASPVKRYGTVSTGTTAPQQMEESGVERLRKKVATLVIPEVEFRDATLTEVAAILTEASKDADKSLDPQKGVTILVNIPNLPRAAGAAAPGGSVLDLPPPTTGGGAAGGAGGGMPTVTLPKIPNFTLARILDYVTEQSGTTKWTVKKDSIEIVPKTAQTDTLILRTWTVSPFIFSSTAPKVDAELSSTGLGGLGLGGPTATAAPKPNNSRRIDAKEFLSGQNVSFAAPNSTATYNPRTKSLTVYNTAEMLELVDQLVADGADSSPVQVEIQARFVEFTQQNLKELSFDWLMGQSNLPGTEKIFSGGGTTGSQRPSLNSSDFPFTIPSNGAFPNGGNPVGVFPVTGGNRSGKLALSSSAIDALLAGATGGGGLAGPGAFSIAGALTDPQFQMVLRAMNQSKAIDLLSSPSIVARNQEEANIDIVREFMYPTAFTPPQIGGAAGGAAPAAGGAAANNTAAAASIPVTPTTPSDFLKRDTGVKLKVNPTIQPDRYSVDLDLRPEVIEFEGFINYGSPIQTVATQSAITTAVGGIASTPKAITLTDNVINQPIFAVRRIQTNVTLLDGETIALGGLIREDVQKVDDKVPVLGDIPLVGRLFRSKVDQHIKKNLTIFVTARIIDAAGQPIKTNKAEQEPPEEVPALTAPR